MQMRRRISGWCAAGLGLVALEAAAQVDLQWALVHNRTVRMEPIQAMIRIANDSGRDLVFGPGGNAQLAFDVEDQPTATLPPAGPGLLAGPLVVAAGDRREVTVNLLDGYSVIKAQSYMLTPVVVFGGVRFTGPRLSLEVQPGLELLQRNAGLPGTESARTASLRLIHRDKSDRLFFSLENPATGYNLGVYELGPVIRYFSPGLEIDASGGFHVLHQTAPERYVHSVFAANGAPAGTEFYSAEVGRIRLQRDEAGAVTVTGGNRFEEDPDNPGVLTAPPLPKRQPHNASLGEVPEKFWKLRKDDRGKKVEPPPVADRGEKVQ